MAGVNGDFDDEIKRILERDPVDEAEKGLHVGPDPDLDPPAPEGTIDDRDQFETSGGIQETLQHAFKVNALKKAAMLVTGDTTFSNSLDRYLAIANEIGFKVVLELPFSVKQCFDELHRNERLFVLWHTDGILLVFDTYEGNRVNGGHFYYNWLANERGDRQGVTSSGGYVLPSGKRWQDVEGENLVWAGDHDCREGLKFHIRQLRKYGKFLPKWEQRPFLWFLHHGDTANKQYGEYDSSKINEERIALLPLEVQEAIRAR
jgi:hypothetical protein